MHSADVVVIGGGVIGSAIAWNLAKLGAGRVVLLERARVGEGAGAQSSGILRTHYTVSENVALAQWSWQVFCDFAQTLGDDQADCGLVRCGYLIATPAGAKSLALRQALQAQSARGIAVQILSAQEAQARLPIARFDDAELIGFEPHAGFADPYLVATSYARAARRLGVQVREGVAALGLQQSVSGAITGVVCSDGVIHTRQVVSAQNIWASELQSWCGLRLPLQAERHCVLALQVKGAPYGTQMPVFKDLASPGLVYYRSYGGAQMLASEGGAGETLAIPDTTQGEVTQDYMVQLGEQVAQRFPAYAEAGVASAWTGVYDVTPDWNPILGPVAQHPGLWLATGFSGHGFKLSPAVGCVMAQALLGLPTEVPLAPYSLSRFAPGGRQLVGAYGAGAVS